MAEGHQYLDFEKPLVELEKKISDMKDFNVGGGVQLDSEIQSMREKLVQLRSEIYSGLSRWQRVQLSRHPRRPHSLDFIKLMATDFIELHGDRCFSDDHAMIGGFAKLDGEKVMIVAQEKGRDTKDKLRRNFGMAHPEGYRKALRFFHLAERFGVPIVILIDTPGAYPGIGAEERGQAWAIAENLRALFRIKVPIVIVILGEGASGGALGIGIGDRVLVLEYAWYSVISPEACAAILWRDSGKGPEAAEALKPTAETLLRLGVVDKIVPEPPSGAHNDPAEAARLVKADILAELAPLKSKPVAELLEERLLKFRAMGEYKVRL
jgi:acetyl-CoA carboxylase carboxyl transferase subunit alpha